MCTPSEKRSARESSQTTTDGTNDTRSRPLGERGSDKLQSSDKHTFQQIVYFRVQSERESRFLVSFTNRSCCPRQYHHLDTIESRRTSDLHFSYPKSYLIIITRILLFCYTTLRQTNTNKQTNNQPTYKHHDESTRSTQGTHHCCVRYW